MWIKDKLMAVVGKLFPGKTTQQEKEQDDALFETLSKNKKLKKRRILAGVVTAMLLISLAACGAGEERTLTGMVTAVEGTVVSIVQMDGNRGQMNGQRPSQSENDNGKGQVTNVLVTTMSGFGGKWQGAGSGEAATA